jgi:hypothetical protein
MVAFPSSSGTRQQSLVQAFGTLRDVAASVKSRSASLNAACAAGNVGSGALLDYATYLADAKLSLQAASSVSGIAAFAQEQIGDATFDIVASFTAMMAQIDATTAWFIANFPKDGSGFLLAKTFAAANNGRTQDRQFTPAQTAGLRTVLDALIATID